MLVPAAVGKLARGKSGLYHLIPQPYTERALLHSLQNLGMKIAVLIPDTGEQKFHLTSC